MTRSYKQPSQQAIPLSLYVHMPWCVQKCPYCDFNSHALNTAIPEQDYIDALIQDLEQDLAITSKRPLQSIFIGGGTPSLFSAAAIEKLLNAIQVRIPFIKNIEITLEANPGTVEQQRFADFRTAGVNRLSLGVQSFQDNKLQNLGRIHDAKTAQQAIHTVRNAGFENFNLDLMHGLPQQSVADALIDLTTALRLQPPHLSWYQLTIEPNTVFYRYPPKLPDETHLEKIETEGKAFIAQAGLQQYEVSAYSEIGKQCQHNLNYWQFGDYLGIGAGAHSKLTDLSTGKIKRLRKKKMPKDYLNAQQNFIAASEEISPENLPFEFMLNALRLQGEISFALLQQRTGCELKTIEDILAKAQQKKLLTFDDEALQLTKLGRLFLNDVVEMFIT